MLGNPNIKKPNEPFVWLKQKNSSNKYVWVKQQTTKLGIQSRKFTTYKLTVELCIGGDKILADMSMEEIAKLSFEEKRNWFRSGLELLRIPWTLGADYVSVERTALLESSVEAYNKCNLFKVSPYVLVIAAEREQSFLGGKN